MRKKELLKRIEKLERGCKWLECMNNTNSKNIQLFLTALDLKENNFVVLVDCSKECCVVQFLSDDKNSIIEKYIPLSQYQKISQNGNYLEIYSTMPYMQKSILALVFEINAKEKDIIAVDMDEYRKQYEQNIRFKEANPFVENARISIF